MSQSLKIKQGMHVLPISSVYHDNGKNPVYRRARIISLRNFYDYIRRKGYAIVCEIGGDGEWAIINPNGRRRTWGRENTYGNFVFAVEELMPASENVLNFIRLKAEAGRDGL